MLINMTATHKPVIGWLLAAAMLAAGGASAATDEPKKETPPPAAAPPVAVAAEQIDKLIEQLGDKDYYVRQRAQDELARLGFEAFDDLSAATTHEDLEISARAKYLLRLMRVEWTAKSDPPEVQKLLRDYELRNAEERQARMHALAVLPDGQGIAALCRLVRFEKSLLLSKLAAMELLQSPMAGDPPKPAAIDAVRRTFSGCKRPSAAWLIAWTRLAANPETAMAEWSRLIDAEQDALRRAPNDSRPEIVAGLIRFQIARLKKLGKPDETMVAIRRLVDLERGDPESLGELLQWLVEQKAWKAVDELAQRFAPRFATEPGLLYALAQSYAEQGQKERAEEMAGRALRLYPGKQQEPLSHHLIAAQNLRQRGLFAWARREFEHVVAQGTAGDMVTIAAQLGFSEMLHDQGEELDAAATLEKLLKSLDARKAQEADITGRTVSELRARMNFFHACHWEKKDDQVKRREYLDKALEADATDVDVLIACYRLAGQPAEYHPKIVELIKKSAAGLRQQIAENPENPITYNQIAWLIGNTEGDFDEALKYSRKSLELSPDNGGYYDTLARVCYAKGELENAVKYQTKAIEMEPYSGLMQRQLELFRKKLEEKKKP